MWPWLQNEHFKKSFSLTQRQKFLWQLCLLAFCGHIVIIIIFTISYHGYHEHEKFVISSKNYKTVYVLSPLNKKIKSARSNLNQKQSIKASRIIDYQTYQYLKNKKNGKTFVEKSKHKKISKTIAAKKSILPIKKIQIAKKLIETKNNFKSIKEPKAKLINKQIAKEKIITQKKPDVVKLDKKKEVPTKIITIEQSITPEQLPKNKSEIKKEIIEEIKPEIVDINESKPVVEESEQKTDLTFEEQQDIPDDIDIDNATFIGYQQIDSLAVKNKIQQEIQQNFKAPIGIKKNVSCELTVFISDKGKSKTVTITKSSGILIYDSSARAMLRKIEFPQEVWNKTITIALGQ